MRCTSLLLLPLSAFAAAALPPAPPAGDLVHQANTTAATAAAAATAPPCTTCPPGFVSVDEGFYCVKKDGGCGSMCEPAVCCPACPSCVLCPAAAGVPEVFAVDPAAGKAGDLVGLAGAGFVNSSSLVCRFGNGTGATAVPVYWFRSASTVYVHVPAAPAVASGGAAKQPWPIAARVLVSCANDGAAFSAAQPHDFFTYTASE